MRRKIIRLTTSFLLPIMACTQGAAAQDTAAQDAAIQEIAIQQTSAQKMHEYYVISAPLTDLLVQIARDVDLEIEFDSEKQVYVTSTHLSGTDTELIAQLTSKFDLSHFMFNGTSYLGMASDQKARIVRSEDYEMVDMIAAIEKSGLELGSYRVTAIANPKAFILTAPPRMLAITETIIDSMPPKETASTAKKIVVRRGVTVDDPETE